MDKDSAFKHSHEATEAPEISTGRSPEPQHQTQSQNDYITREDLDKYWQDKFENNIKMLIESLVNERVDLEVKRSQRRNNAAALSRRQGPSLSNFGQENYEYILPSMNALYKSDDVFGTLQRVIKDLYFNPNQKKNHNIYVPRESYNYACIYKDNAWRTYPIDYCIDAVIRRANDVIQHYIVGTDSEFERNFEADVGKKNIERYTEFTNKIDTMEDTPDFRQRLYRETEHTILTNQHFVHQRIFQTPPPEHG